MKGEGFIVGPDDLLLVTGAAGFIGSRVVEHLLDRGFRNLRCFARPSSNGARIKALLGPRDDGARVEVFKGNLLSQEDCIAATKDVAVVYHLAAGRGEKSYPDAFLNSVVTTRNLLQASLLDSRLKRFVNVSSFVAYSGAGGSRGALLDETCPLEQDPELEGEAYCFAKVRQDEMVMEYGKKFGIPYVILRPGSVYGPGNEAISARVGIDTFGVFLHLGGSNPIPLTYVDNCAEAITLAGLKEGIDGEAFNVIDDDLPTSRDLLRLYKRNVRHFTSLYLPRAVSYALCYLWEKYSRWSEEQLPPAYNPRRWRAYWRKRRFSNDKLKRRVGWRQRIPTQEGLRRYFEACRARERNA